MKEQLNKEKDTGKRAITSVLLVLIALVAVSAATVAWLSIADSTRVRSLSMDVTSGVSLRFDLDPHERFEDYVKTLTFREISARIKKDYNVDVNEVPLEPVTTRDAVEFTYEDGTVVTSDKGSYLEFVLNFMSTEDMIVHLTSANSRNKNDGTGIGSKKPHLRDAMRISFTMDDETVIYDPGMGDSQSKTYGMKTFGLADSEHMKYNDNNALFSIKAGENKPVTVHVWLEGTDDYCTDALKGADYQIRLRFQGTDFNNVLFEDAEASKQ